MIETPDASGKKREIHDLLYELGQSKSKARLAYFNYEVHRRAIENGSLLSRLVDTYVTNGVSGWQAEYNKAAERVSEQYSDFIKIIANPEHPLCDAATASLNATLPWFGLSESNKDSILTNLRMGSDGDVQHRSREYIRELLVDYMHYPYEPWC